MLRRSDGSATTITAGDVCHDRRPRRTDRSAAWRAPSDELVFAPLGGVGEIGMNLAIYGFGDERRRQWIIVDVGVAFAGDDLPGIDLILPDIRYLIEERSNILGIVLTHAHEDHFGAMLDLWPRLKLPVYATPFTAALVEGQAGGRAGGSANSGQHRAARAAGSRSGRSTSSSSRWRIRSRNRTASSSARRSAPCSIPATGRSIRPRSSARRPTKRKLRALGDAGCLALIGDSTNAVREGRSPSESDVAKIAGRPDPHRARRASRSPPSRRTWRGMRAVAEAAAACDREVVLVGRSMERIAQVARETGYLDGIRDFRSVEVYGHLPPDKVVRALHRQPGRAARRALAHRRRRPSRRRALARRPRDLFLARHPGQREAGRCA